MLFVPGISNLYTGLRATPLPQHFFFLDACRNDHQKLREMSLEGAPVLNPCPAWRVRPDIISPIVYATGPGAAAWAPQNPHQGISVFGRALVEKGAGIRPEAEPLSEGLSTLGPTAVLTGLTMGMAIPSQRLRARSVEKSLEDEKSLPEARRAAADHVAAYMAEADEGFAKRWRVRDLFFFLYLCRLKLLAG